MEYE
ncbi:hypothetical protein AX774_g4383, partial [Zancudomyces culisetae]